MQDRGIIIRNPDEMSERAHERLQIPHKMTIFVIPLR